MQPPILTLDEDTPEDELRVLVRGTVEEAVNGILDAQADELVNAERYERTDERQAHGSGHHSRGPPAQAGKIEVSVPKPGGARLAAEAVERHGRRESSVEEAPVETYLLGVSTRNVEDAARILWDEGISAGTAPDPDQEAFKKVDAWRRRPLASERPHACVDGTYARGNWGGAHEGVAVLVAIGADSDGRREAVGVEEGHGESEDSWREFLLGLRDRGLSEAGPAAGDEPAGMLGALSEALPSAEHRRRAARSCLNVLAKVPKRRRKAVAARPEATRAQESPGASARKAKEVAGSPGTSGLADAARVVEEGRMETPACASFPPEHWRRIRTNNGIERPSRETRRRTRAVAGFPDGRAATMLAAARCEHMAEGNWGTKRYLDAGLLEGWDVRGSAEG